MPSKPPKTIVIFSAFIINFFLQYFVEMLFKHRNEPTTGQFRSICILTNKKNRLSHRGFQQNSANICRQPIIFTFEGGNAKMRQKVESGADTEWIRDIKVST